MIGHFFYFCGLKVFLSNLNFIYHFFDYIRVKEWSISFQKVTKRFPSDKDFKRGDFEKFKKYSGVVALNFFWLFFGILSSSWKIYLVLLSLHLFINLIIRAIGEFKMFSKYLLLIKILIINLSILVLTINHFHLHLNLFQILLNIFR